MTTLKASFGGTSAVPTTPYVLPTQIFQVVFSNFEVDLERFSKALAAFDVGKGWHLHNVGEWWMLWTVLVEAHKQQVERFVLPPLARVTDAGKDIKAKLATIFEYVARITTNLLKLQDGSLGTGQSRDAIVARIRTLNTSFQAEFLSYIALARERILPLWSDLPLPARASAEVTILMDYIGFGQWALPWLGRSLTLPNYEGFVRLLPGSCPNVKYTLHRYWRPQWISRIEPLLVSVYDPSVMSPTFKPAPNVFYCWDGYDAEDNSAAYSSYCWVVPSLPRKPKAPKQLGSHPAEAKKAAPAPAPAPVKAAAAPPTVAETKATPAATPAKAAPVTASPAGAGVSTPAKAPATASPATATLAAEGTPVIAH